LFFLLYGGDLMSEKALPHREKRRSLRVPAPKEATAIFKNEKGDIDRIHIKDLSLSGMLTFASTKGERYNTGEVINNIYLNMHVAALDTDSKFYLLIAKGEIVRSFIDEASQTVNYGIEFKHNFSDDKYKLRESINILAPNSYR
jgi:hypothetical protein